MMEMFWPLDTSVKVIEDGNIRIGIVEAPHLSGPIQVPHADQAVAEGFEDFRRGTGGEGFNDLDGGPYRGSISALGFDRCLHGMGTRLQLGNQDIFLDKGAETIGFSAPAGNRRCQRSSGELECTEAYCGPRWSDGHRAPPGREPRLSPAEAGNAKALAL